MERLLLRTTCRLPRLVRRREVAVRFHTRAVSCVPARPRSIVPDSTLPAQTPESSQTPANSTVPNLFSLRDRTIIVTGAGRGLGITLALAVLEAGGNVVCLDVLPEPSKTEWRRISQLAERSGLDATYHQCDATDEEHVRRVLATAALRADTKKQPIRGLIHCAGIQQVVDAIDYPLDGFRRILDVNVIGSFIMAKHTARFMREAGVGGSLVFIASMSGQVTNRVRTQVCLPSTALLNFD